MALIACPECGRQVSTLAQSCPSCGAPIAAQGRAGAPREPLVNAGLLGKLAAVLGAWLVVPWVVRLLAFLGGLVVLAVMFVSAR